MRIFVGALNVLIYNPGSVAVFLFALLFGILLWDGIRNKSSRVALVSWKAFSILSLSLFLPPLSFYFVSLPWYGQIFVCAWIIAAFLAVWIDKLKNPFRLTTLAITSFAVPLMGLFVTCVSNMPFLVAFLADGPGTVSCAFGFTAAGITVVIVEACFSVYLLISALLIRRFSGQEKG